MHIRFTAPVTLVAFGLLVSATAQEAPRPSKGHPQSEPCVAVDVRIVSVTNEIAERFGLDLKLDGLERIGVDFNAGCAGQPPAAQLSGTMPVACLNDARVCQFLEAVQADKQCNVCLAPKLMVLNGQTACIKVGSEHLFVTGMRTVKDGDQTVTQPKTETRTTGLELCVQPNVSADRRFVQLKVRSQLTNLVPKVPLFPVTTYVTPVYEGGAQGNPVPFTQYIQQPAFNVQTFEKVLAVPDGGTAVVSALKCSREPVECDTVPVLAKLPYLNRLFKTVPAPSRAETVVMLLTPRIVMNKSVAHSPPPSMFNVLVQTPPSRPTPVMSMRPAAFSSPPPMVVAPVQPPATYPLTAVAPSVKPASNWVSVGMDCTACCVDEGSAAFRTRQVAKLVEMYREACAGGHHAEARKLAACALELDPACFSKSAAPRSK